MPKTRKERRRVSKEVYLDGRARNPHIHTPSLQKALTETDGAIASSALSGVCLQCAPVLSRYCDTFLSMVHRGSELKRKKAINPAPKKDDAIPYRDIVRQNEWLRQNCFDSLGNYLYCASCIRSALGISKDRLTKQHNIKRQQSQIPVVDMKKVEIEQKRLTDYVIMPETVEISFIKWWRSLESSFIVGVRIPHERHGNAGKVSNSAKTTLREAFLQFVDANSQPNGRSADSSGPTSYFLPKFSTIQMPKITVAHYNERMSRLVVGEFNRVQREQGKQECSNGSSHNWLKQYRPKLTTCPHQEDYCDTCSKNKAKIHAIQTTMNRLQQSGNALMEEIKSLEEEIKKLNQDHETHRDEAQKSHTYYTEVTSRCAKEWNDITAIEERETLTEEEKIKLDGLKCKFNLVISVDYQMSKLIPYWGYSAQPGSTYYLQKLSHDIFGIVNHAWKSSTIYLFDERSGPKNTDHTISFLTDYLKKLPTWIRRVHIFLDNTSSTNKNCFMMSWAYEMLQQKKVDFLRLSFLIAGHTKFAPDLLFSQIAQSYNHSDVFTTEELKGIISPYAEVIIDDGSIVCNWRDVLTRKYSKVDGIRALHDFIFVTNSITSTVLAKVRKLCYAGPFQQSPSHVLRGRNLEESVIPNLATNNYCVLRLTKPLTETKFRHLKQMYKDFIPSDKHPNFLDLPSDSTV